MIRTFQTSMENHKALPALGELFGFCTRRLHSEMVKGRGWSGDLQTRLYRELGVNSAFMAHVNSNLTATHKSILALRENHRKDLEKRVATKAKQIETKSKALIKFEKDLNGSNEKLLSRKMKTTVLAGNTSTSFSTAAQNGILASRAPTFLPKVQNISSKSTNRNTRGDRTVRRTDFTTLHSFNNTLRY